MHYMIRNNEMIKNFLHNKVKKSKKVFDKGQKVRYTVTIKGQKVK